MSKKTEAVLNDVAARAIEELGFMFPMPEEDGFPGRPDIAVTVPFSGPFDGQLRLAVSKNMIPVLAANMLGLDDDESPDNLQCVDALKELANVICGNLLPHVAGPDSVFNLQSPVLDSSDESSPVHAGAPSVGTSRLTLDEGAVELSLHVEGGNLP